MTNTAPKIPCGTVLLHKFQGARYTVRRTVRRADGTLEAYDVTRRDEEGQLHVTTFPAHVLEGLVEMGQFVVIKTAEER